MDKITLKDKTYLTMKRNGWVRRFRADGILLSEHMFPFAETKKATLQCMRELAREINATIENGKEHNA